MFNFGKKKQKVNEVFRSIGSGTVISLENVPDQVFSQKMMGDGFAVELTDGHVYAPVSGDVTLVFPTGHAFGITTADGLEILIHLGIDTVELNGKGFDGKVKQGDSISQGDLLTVMDLDFIKENGKSVISPVIFTSGQTITLNKENSLVDEKTEDIFTFNA